MAQAATVQKMRKALRTARKVEFRVKARVEGLPVRKKNRNAFRVAEVELIIRARHDLCRIPDPTGTDETIPFAYLEAVAWSLGDDFAGWAKARAPWVFKPEHNSILAAITMIAAGRKRDFTADHVGRMLGITFEKRKELGLKTIGCCDMTTEERKLKTAKERLTKERERQANKRQSQGRKPRAEYEAGSLTALKPWIDQGISKSAWYKRIARANVSAIRETSVLQVSLTESVICNTPVHFETNPTSSFILRKDDSQVYQTADIKSAREHEIRHQVVGCGVIDPAKASAASACEANSGGHKNAA